MCIRVIKILFNENVFYNAITSWWYYIYNQYCFRSSYLDLVWKHSFASQTTSGFHQCDLTINIGLTRYSYPSEREYLPGTIVSVAINSNFFQSSFCHTLFLIRDLFSAAPFVSIFQIKNAHSPLKFNLSVRQINKNYGEIWI